MGDIFYFIIIVYFPNRSQLHLKLVLSNSIPAAGCQYTDTHCITITSLMSHQFSSTDCSMGGNILR